MASIRKFKKQINDTLSDVIEECYVSQLTGDVKTYAAAEKVIDEAILTFDGLIVKLHSKDVDNQKAHLKALRLELDEKSSKLMAKIEKLSS